MFYYFMIGATIYAGMVFFVGIISYIIFKWKHLRNQYLVQRKKKIHSGHEGAINGKVIALIL